MKFQRLYQIACLSVIPFLASCGQNPQAMNQSSQIKIVDPALVELDLLAYGPYEVEEADYDSGPYYDAEVLPVTAPGQARVYSDIRGRLFLPRTDGPAPLVVFLHGNHASCGIETGSGNPRLDISSEFTLDGQCPRGFVEVPSHRGYDYSARHLASWGYAVISVNANRGVSGRNQQGGSDPTLVHARGVHVLRHLESFYQWSRPSTEQAPLQPSLNIRGRFDWNQVGLMGHSRGGEGVRYAYNILTASSSSATWQQRIPGLQIRGIFEIAPIDSGTLPGGRPTKVNAVGIPWSVLIPGCDQDVWDFSGAHPFARMLRLGSSAPKSTFTIWGANHNFFNTEWQVSDAPHSCNGLQQALWETNSPPLGGPFSAIAGYARQGLTGSTAQQEYGKALLAAFFRAHLGEQRTPYLQRVFDPQFHLPRQLSEIAPSSREFVKPHESQLVFRPAQELSLPQTQFGITIETYEGFLDREFQKFKTAQELIDRENNNRPRQIVRSAADFSRSSLAISIPQLSERQSIILPFARSLSLANVWTIDLPISKRASCYYGELDCSITEEIYDMDISLLLDDGTQTAAVKLSEYVELKNWLGNFFQLSFVGRTPGSRFSSIEIHYFEALPLLFQTARFEIDDFNIQDYGAAIQGIQLSFEANQGTQSSIFIDDVRVSQRSDPNTLPPNRL